MKYFLLICAFLFSYNVVQAQKKTIKKGKKNASEVWKDSSGKEYTIAGLNKQIVVKNKDSIARKMLGPSGEIVYLDSTGKHYYLSAGKKIYITYNMFKKRKLHEGEKRVVMPYTN